MAKKNTSKNKVCDESIDLAILDSITPVAKAHDDELELVVLEKLSSIEVIEEGLISYQEDLDIFLNPDQMVSLTDLEDLDGFQPSKISKVSSMGRQSVAVDLLDGRTYRVFVEEEEPLRFPRVELSFGLIAYQL